MYMHPWRASFLSLHADAVHACYALNFSNFCTAVCHRRGCFACQPFALSHPCSDWAPKQSSSATCSYSAHNPLWTECKSQCTQRRRRTVSAVMQETRYRQRYLDGIVNHDHVRNIFVTRAKVVQYVRKYLDDRQFLEVTTLTFSLCHRAVPSQHDQLHRFLGAAT